MISVADLDVLNAALAAGFRKGRSRCAACKRPLENAACPTVPWPRAWIPTSGPTLDFPRACGEQCSAMLRTRIAKRLARDVQLNPRERTLRVLQNMNDAGSDAAVDVAASRAASEAAKAQAAAAELEAQDATRRAIRAREIEAVRARRGAA